LAKRYSGDDGHRFINGVLRKVAEQAKRRVAGAEADRLEDIAEDISAADIRPEDLAS
jgi:hypothetical protein